LSNDTPTHTQAQAPLLQTQPQFDGKRTRSGHPETITQQYSKRTKKHPALGDFYSQGPCVYLEAGGASLKTALDITP